MRHTTDQSCSRTSRPTYTHTHTHTHARARRGNAGIQLLHRLDPSRYHLGLPGFPPVDGHLATAPRYDPYTCLPNGMVRQDTVSEFFVNMSYVRDRRIDLQI